MGFEMKQTTCVATKKMTTLSLCLKCMPLHLFLYYLKTDYIAYITNLVPDKNIYPSDEISLFHMYTHDGFYKNLFPRVKK